MIRDFREADARPAASLLRKLKPGWLITGSWLAHFARTVPARARARFWVAEENGRLVGWAEAAFNWVSGAPRRGVGMGRRRSRSSPARPGTRALRDS